MNARKNWNCENDKCRDPKGEVRLLPSGGGANSILCRPCFNHEIAFRKGRIAEGVPFDLPEWGALKVYDGC